MSKKYIVFFIIIMILIINIILLLKINNMVLIDKEIIVNTQLFSTEVENSRSIIKNITLSFVGDCTIGSDESFDYYYSFNDIFQKNNKDYSYFFKGVYDIINKDDLTIANLETTLTDATEKATKTFRFKGDPSYVNILKKGSIEVVNLANNHTYDYLKQGFNGTVSTLEEKDIPYYGRNVILILEVKDIKIGFAGFSYDDTSENKYKRVDEVMQRLNDNNVDLKIISFHWGIERDYQFNETQEHLGEYAIDKGANLVIGHHPHVLQGIQTYNNSNIVYSLGNFVFGGNRNPSDKDSMIYQQTFSFEDKKLIDTKVNIIPVSISSLKNINDYQPTIANGEEKDRILNKIFQYSKDFEYIN